MITTNIDLGQLLIVSIIAIIGWFIKREINTIGKRLDNHEHIIFDLASDLQRVIGYTEGRQLLLKRRGKNEQQ